MRLDRHNQSESPPVVNSGCVNGFPKEGGERKNLTDFSLVYSFITYEKLKRDFYRHILLSHKMVISVVVGIALVLGLEVLSLIWNVYLMVAGQNAAKFGHFYSFQHLPFFSFLIIFSVLVRSDYRLPQNFTKHFSIVIQNQDLGTLPFLIEALNQSRNKFLMTDVHKDILNITTKLLSLAHNPAIPFIDASHHRILNRYLNAKGVQKTPAFVEAILRAYQYLGIQSDLPAIQRLYRLKNISPAMINHAKVAEAEIIRRTKELNSMQTLLRTPTDMDSTLLRVSDTSQEDAS